MTAIDKVRSFAESREPDVAVIRDGITYGDARDLLQEIDRMRALAEESERDARQTALEAYTSDKRSFWARYSYRKALLEANRRRHAERAKAERERVYILALQGELFEHLSLIVGYLEEETSHGDGIAEEHFDGYTASKDLLRRASASAQQWEDAQLELEEPSSETRESCARICDERAKINAKDLNYLDGIRGEEAEACAAAIRAGGKP